MNDKLRRILDLIRRTGDTMVVTDPDGEDVFVIMDIEQYEGILGNTQSKPTPIHSQEPDIWETMKPAGEEGETWDLSQMEEEELAHLEDQYRQFAKNRVESAIEETNKTGSKIQEKPEDSEDFGEEQFYLEPIE